MRQSGVRIILCCVLFLAPSGLQAFDGSFGSLGSSLSVSKVAEFVGLGSAENKAPSDILNDSLNASKSVDYRVNFINSLSAQKDSYDRGSRGRWVEPISKILYAGDYQLVNYNPQEDPIELKTATLDLLLNLLPEDKMMGADFSWGSDPNSAASILNVIAASIDKTVDADFKGVLGGKLTSAYSHCKESAHYLFMGKIDDGLSAQAREIIGEENLCRPARAIGYINVEKSFEPYRNVLSSTRGLYCGTEADKTILTKMVSNDPYGQLSAARKSEWGALIAGGNADITNERKASLFADYVNDYMDTQYYLGTAVREARAGNDQGLKIAEFITKSFQTEDGNAIVFSPDGYGNYSYSIFKAPIRQISVQVGSEQRTYGLPLTRGVGGTSIEYVPAKEKSGEEILLDGLKSILNYKIEL